MMTDIDLLAECRNMYVKGCTRGQTGPVPRCGRPVRDRPSPSDKNRALDALDIGIEISRLPVSQAANPLLPAFYFCRRRCTHL
jgi:hypothetical protein